MGKSFRLAAASRTIGPYAREKPFECGKNRSRFVGEEKATDECERRTGVWLQKKRPGSNASGRQIAARLREDREILLARLRFL
jgi:hypothetical protein